MINNITNYKTKGNNLFRPIISSKYTLRIYKYETLVENKGLDLDQHSNMAGLNW